MAPKSKNEEYPAFTVVQDNFTIKVDVKGSWQNTVKKVVNSVQGVTNFRMENNGTINISGYVEPTLLLKCLRKAGKTAQIVHWQYGECSSNLFERPKSPSNDDNDNNNDGNGLCGYYFHPGYGGYNGYGYDYCYPTYRRNYAYNHLECAGNASDCSAHHMENPRIHDKSSSTSLFNNLPGSGKVPTSRGNGAICCCLM